MKEIKALIAPARLSHVLTALRKNSCFTERAVNMGGRCPTLSISHVERALLVPEPALRRYGVNPDELVRPLVRIEILCADDQARPLVDAIAVAAQTGERESGSVLVTEVEHVHTID